MIIEIECILKVPLWQRMNDKHAFQLKLEGTIQIFLSPFFAKYSDLLDLIINGVLFHNLVASFWNVHSAMFEDPSFTRSPFDVALDVLIETSAFCLK